MSELHRKRTVRLCLTALVVGLGLFIDLNLEGAALPAAFLHTLVRNSSRPTLPSSSIAETDAPDTATTSSLRQISRTLGRVASIAHTEEPAPVYRISAAASRPSSTRATASPVPHPTSGRPVADPWHTAGNQILDSHNRPVRIAGISWYGFETTAAAPHGLTHQDYRAILAGIRGNGYNTVRLPFSNSMLRSTNPPEIAFQDINGEPINAELEGLTSLEVMDHIIRAAGDLGLRVILDNHRSSAGDGPESNGLWYTAAYPESVWIHDWQTLAARYANDPTVVGMDLRNEPHNATSGGSCWGCGTRAQDWRLAAERAGAAILRTDSRLLIFVEGTDTVDGDSYWWGGNLEGVRYAPVRLPVAHRLVYSAHDYGPSESTQPWFNAATTSRSLDAVWTSHWAFISQANIAPVWLSEFGTVNDPAAIHSTTPGSEGQWFGAMISFLQANPDLSWAYWAVNGDDRYGLLDRNFNRTPASGIKQQALASIEAPLSLELPETGSALATK